MDINNTISLAMIIKNEEKILARCLNSFKNLVDEIIIVDTGSTDKSKEIAKKYTNNVFDYTWCNDFSKARNYSFSKCTKNYILWVDADDVFDKKQEKPFFELKEIIANYDVIMLKYNISFNKQKQPTFSYYRERILKNDNTFVWHDEVHETITPHGKVFYSDLAINHHPTSKQKNTDRNLMIYENIIKKGKTLSPRQKYYYSRELMYNQKYDMAIKNFENYLLDKNLWKENAISACRDLSNCYLQLNQIDKAKHALLRSFVFDRPRGEVCCSLGNIFIMEKNYKLAIFWYEQALNATPELQSGAFIEQEYYSLIPHLQLCVCYYNLGDFNSAKHHNDLAGLTNNFDKAYLFNKQFFETLNNKLD